MNGSAYFLVGPTASGKSAVAQFLAERSGRSVVSADSMNIYRGMDIGTAKPTEVERGTVQYAGVDLAEPTDDFSVAAYLRAVKPAFASGREIIVTGGTGLYVKCLTEGFDRAPPKNPALRAKLEELSLPELQARAQHEAEPLFEKLTPDDRSNPRRLIRILEKVDGENAPVAASWNRQPKPTLVGLHVERALLHQRIEARVEQMYAAGILDEARLLMALQLSQTARQAIGYAEAFAVLKNEMTLDEAKERTVIRTRQLAKRQMTWFRNQLNVHWIDVTAPSDIQTLSAAVSEAWGQFGAASVYF